MAVSVLVLIPVKPAMNAGLKARITEIAAGLPAANPALSLRVVIDDAPEPSQPGDCRAWSKVTRVRNNLLARVPWQDFDYVMWIDADVVEMPADLPTRLVETAAGGVAAPLVLVEGGDTFYDWAAFVEAGQSHNCPEAVDGLAPRNIPGRNFSHAPPYWLTEPAVDVVPVDCVGTVYVVHADVYRAGAVHEDHVAFTDHWPVCAKAREMGRPVVVDRRLTAFHANLPAWGEPFH